MKQKLFGVGFMIVYVLGSTFYKIKPSWPQGYT